MHSFLLIGQSNAGGRGFQNEAEPIQNDRIFVLRNGRWRPMYVPVNPDRVTSGISLIESFADLYAKEKDVDVGIIPCADGGSCLDQWCVGSLLFDHACYMAELASRTSGLAGVLWHQGESDCWDDRYPFYEEKLLSIIEALRERLGLYDTPFLLGGLGDFLKNCTRHEYYKNYVHINAALQRIAQQDTKTGFVSAEGLTANPDNLHFSAHALRTFGVRYYEVFRLLENKDRSFVEKTTIDSTVQSDIELL